MDTIDGSQYQACSLSASYREYLTKLASKLDEMTMSSLVKDGASSAGQGSSALLINLGPVWNDIVADMRICVWQMQDCIWESPAGLGLIDLGALASICSRIHEHLARIKNQPKVILHPHTCSHSGLQMAYYVTVAHHIYSAGMESVGDALGVLTRLNGDARLLPGQKRYCEYLSWVLHHPHLVPEEDASYRLGSVRFRKLDAFHVSLPEESREWKQRLKDRPEGDASQAEIDEAAMGSFRPERLLLVVYCSGQQVWSGGVTPGSVMRAEKDGGDGVNELSFDTKGVSVHGDVVIAVWFDDHTSRWAPPRVAYAFHTLFLPEDGYGGGSAACSVRVLARHMDTPDASDSYSELAEKEGFWMDVGIERCEGAVGQSSVGSDVRHEWLRTMKATGGKLKISSEVEEVDSSRMTQPMRSVLAELREAVKGDVVDDALTDTTDTESPNPIGIGGEKGGRDAGGEAHDAPRHGDDQATFAIDDEWTRKCQEALDDLRRFNADSDEEAGVEQSRGPERRGDVNEAPSPRRTVACELGSRSAVAYHADACTQVDTPLREQYRQARTNEEEAGVSQLLSRPAAPPGIVGTPGKAAPPPPPPMPGPMSAASTPGKAAPPPPPPMPGSMSAASTPGKAAPPPPPPPMPGPISSTSTPEKGIPPPPPPSLPGANGSPVPPGPAAPPMPGSTPVASPGMGISPNETPKTQQGPRLRSVFWKKNLLKDGTVWSDINASNPMLSSDLLDVEMNVLRELFTQKEKVPPSAVKNTGKVEDKDADGSGGVKSFQLVQDLTRANNIAIMLKSFASFGDPLSIKRAILEGDDSLTERHIEQLKQMAPRPVERENVACFTGRPSDLHLPEQFLIVLADIPRLDRKLNVLLFKKQFDALVQGAARGMDALNVACRQIKESRRLKCVFASILAAGNALNADTIRAGAKAIKLESILVLSGVKVVRGDVDEASDDGLPTPRLKTLLDYVSWRVMCAELCNGDLDDGSLMEAANDGFLMQELGNLRQAVLLVESDVKQNVESLENGMNLVQGELELERKGPHQPLTGATGMPAASLATRLEAADDRGTSQASHTSPYLAMLEDFSSSAEKAQADILALAERTNAAQQDILEWMSERGGGVDAPGVLKGLLDFSRDFDSSFSRVYKAIGGTKGAREWAARLSANAAATDGTRTA